MNLGLEEKVAVITGGSDGIGKAAALSMSREGVRVAIAARDQSKLDAAVADISDQTQNRVLGISTDVRDEDSVRSLISQAWVLGCPAPIRVQLRALLEDWCSRPGSWGFLPL